MWALGTILHDSSITHSGALSYQVQYTGLMHTDVSFLRVPGVDAAWWLLDARCHSVQHRAAVSTGGTASQGV
jgi:hypothetical protein